MYINKHIIMIVWKINLFVHCKGVYQKNYTYS